jgi:hypothetical protein
MKQQQERKAQEQDQALCRRSTTLDNLQCAAAVTAVAIPLYGAAGVYVVAVSFDGVARLVLPDTGSPLSWVPRASTDIRLRTDGQTDGDTYSDGQMCKGQFSYGALVISGSPSSPGCGASLAGSIELADAGLLLVDGMDGGGIGILGLNRRQAAPTWEHGGLPHPGDLITQILTRLPQPFISFHFDPRQAQAPDFQLGPSTLLLGGLHGGDPRSYVWAACCDGCEADWIVRLAVAFVGPTGTRRWTDVRVLVDTGCSCFKVTTALGAAVTQQWGVDLPPPDVACTTALHGCEPRAERLKELSVVFMVETTEFAIGAADLMYVQGDAVVCNRVKQSDRMSGDRRSHRDPNADHDMVMGNAFLAGLGGVAFDYHQARVGFLAQ